MFKCLRSRICAPGPQLQALVVRMSSTTTCSSSPKASDFSIGYFTIGEVEEAQSTEYQTSFVYSSNWSAHLCVVELAKSLLEAKLVACVNITPQVISMYWWQGAIQNQSESLLTVKTRTRCEISLIARSSG